jgi:hypothetical protein
MTTMSDIDLTVISSEKVEGTAVYNPGWQQARVHR